MVQHRAFTWRRSPWFDARFRTFVQIYPGFWWTVLGLSVINISSIKLPYMKYFNLEEFSMMPLVGWKVRMRRCGVDTCSVRNLNTTTAAVRPGDGEACGARVCRG